MKRQVMYCLLSNSYHITRYTKSGSKTRSYYIQPGSKSDIRMTNLLRPLLCRAYRIDRTIVQFYYTIDAKARQTP